MRIKIPGLYIVLCVVLAGLIHIVAVLTLPALAPKNAQARLAALGPANTMIELPAAAPGRQAMPMMAPDVRYAFCRFDLTNGPIRLSATIADDLWLIGLYTAEGDNFYAVAGADSPETSEEILVVNSPVTEGIAMIRAPLKGPSRAERADEALKTTSCGPYTKAG